MEAAPPIPGSLREQGSASFKAGQYLKAAALYTKAITEDPTSAVLQSNLSAALLKLKKVAKALAAADECIRLEPQYEKGYYRRGAVLEAMDGKILEATEAYFKAWQLNTSNAEVSCKVQLLCRKLKQTQQKVPEAIAAAAPELAAVAAAAAAAKSSGFSFKAGSTAPAPSAATPSPAPAPAKASAPAAAPTAPTGAASAAPAAAAASPAAAAAAEPLTSSDAMPGIALSGSAGPLLAALGATAGGRMASEFLSMAMQIVGDSYDEFVPSVHFLPGPEPQRELQEEQTHVRAAAAFETPDTLTSFVEFLRNQATALDAKAVVALVPRHAVAYPQVWNKPGWPHGAGSGIFVQLESMELRRIWFVMAQPGSELGSLSELPYETFSLLPRLIKMG